MSDVVDVTAIEDNQARRAGGAGAGLPLLSQREQLVLRAYASGLTLDSVARRLGISRETARTYLKRVKAKYKRAGMPAYTKLDLADRLRASQAGLRASQAGLRASQAGLRASQAGGTTARLEQHTRGRAR